MAEDYDDFVEVSYAGEELDLGDVLLSPLDEIVELVRGADDDDGPITATEAEGAPGVEVASADRHPSDDDWLDPASGTATGPGGEVAARAGDPSISGGEQLAEGPTGADPEADSWLDDASQTGQSSGLTMPDWLTREPPADESSAEKEARERTEQAKMDAFMQEHANIENALRGIRA